MIGAPRQGRDNEHRFPAALAIVVGAALYAALPSNLTLGSRFVIPALELVLLLPVLAYNPRRFTRQTTWSRVLSLALVGVIGLANLFSLILLIRALIQGGATDSHKLLLAALQVWLTNIIVFGLAYWELDRGGPVKRATLARADFPPPTSGSLRTRTPTRLPKWPPRRPIALIGRPFSSTTSTCRSPTVRPSVPPTRCRCPAEPNY